MEGWQGGRKPSRRPAGLHVNHLRPLE